MRALVDTNVVLDVLLGRAEFLADSQQVLSLARHGRFEALLGATTVTTLDYLLARHLGKGNSRPHMRALLHQYDVAAVDAAVLRRALELPLADYEDSVLCAAAAAAGVDAIITRDRSGFAGAPMPVLSPAEAIAVVVSEGGQH